ncbi:hypothetical protein Poly30_21690 [Planctomycetes bacterium Poly30]|uniref:FG-GAP repeat protein n=1 Tax=Saltatorellus ferox TaxID=2528018 RepID=A0A518ERD1_9BACT|nr:hypothetical protein Poly30_21690 [Planctomycetes bacterium Poly30]
MLTRFTRAASRSAALLLSLAPLASAQVPSAEVIAVADILTTTPDTLNFILEFRAGADSGWISRASYVNAAGAQESVLYGELSAADAGGPRILRRPQVLAGIDQESLLRPSLAGEQLAYLSQSGVVNSTRAAWLEDSLLARIGSEIGSSGDTWALLEDVINTVPGDVILRGRANSSTTGPLTWARYPAGEILLQHGQAVPGTSETVDRVYEADVSADGQNLIARVRLAPSQHSAILVNGEIYTFPNGGEARSGDPIGIGTLLNASPGETWLGFYAPQINSQGDIVFAGTLTRGASYQTVGLRNGREMPSGPYALATIGATHLDERGFALTAVPSDTLPGATFEGIPLATSSLEVDFDGDGYADPGYRIYPSIVLEGATAMNGAGGIYGLANLEIPGGTSAYQAIFRSTFVQEGNQYCAGEVNVTGRPARLSSVGSDVIAFNKMKLVATGLRSGSLCLPLFSLTPGNGVQPPGSVGTLCLGGAIGRAQYSLLNGGNYGSGSVDIFLNVIPQPNGPRAVQPGDTWYAQLWYRDGSSSTVTSNFSDAISIRFR